MDLKEIGLEELGYEESINIGGGSLTVTLAAISASLAPLIASITPYIKAAIKLYQIIKPYLSKLAQPVIPY